MLLAEAEVLIPYMFVCGNVYNIQMLVLGSPPNIRKPIMFPFPQVTALYLGRLRELNMHYPKQFD